MQKYYAEMHLVLFLAILTFYRATSTTKLNITIFYWFCMIAVQIVSQMRSFFKILFQAKKFF